MTQFKYLIQSHLHQLVIDVNTLKFNYNKYLITYILNKDMNIFNIMNFSFSLNRMIGFHLLLNGMMVTHVLTENTSFYFIQKITQ